MLKIGIIVGSTRPGRNSEAVARWVHENASKKQNVKLEIVDIQKFNLPIFDEPIPPAMGQYTNEHTKKWAAAIDSFDAFVFVTPEYNHSIPGVLKNAIDFLFKEWNHKAAGVVSYGSVGGTRAVEHLRTILAELHVATVRSQVALSLFADFENFSTFKPGPQHQKSLDTMLDQVIAWGEAFKAVRASS